MGCIYRRGIDVDISRDCRERCGEGCGEEIDRDVDRQGRVREEGDE